ncbi:MAG: peptidoglycan -binding protein [Xanthobacteraceae bacterium]|nr:peptidoglycan -binding protein [Xanthobacteraceae bacterium]QYK44565.1 MAG: peptidoglycan -binding protein [Xanthobacteraceae bacterium]
MALGRSRADRRIDYWPGFVDALSTLLLVFIFLISVFMIAQYFLGREIAGKQDQLTRLNVQLKQLADLLSLERATSASLEDQLSGLRASLRATEAERDKLRGDGVGLGDAKTRIDSIAADLEAEKKLSSQQVSQITLLNQQLVALRRQIAALEAALEASEKREKESQTKISDLGSRLNVALAQRVQELNRYRSDFFGRLREVLGNRPEIRIVGDRFVFQSEVFFDPGSADLKDSAAPELDKLAAALLELVDKIPKDIPWVLRVDGHTDVRPISNARFPSNWELSSSRAISVVKYLMTKGLSPDRLVAAGFGEFQPIDPANNDDAYRRNRRIELKITER